MTAPKLPKGHQSLYSPGFKYTPAASTDIAKTFARIRRERKAAEVAAKDSLDEASERVYQFAGRLHHDKR